MGFRQKRCQRRTASESAFESQPPSVDTYDPDQVAEVMFTTMFPPGADRMALANMINRAEAIGMAPTDMTPEGDAAVRGVVDSLVRCVLIVEPDWPEDFARAVVGARVARLQSYGSTEPIDLGSRTGGEPGLQPPDDSSQPDLSEKGARRPLHAVHPRDRRQAVARAHSGDAVVGAAIAGAAEMAHAARSGDAAAIADSAEQALDHVAETLFTRALSPTADELARTLAGMINYTILSGQPITAEARAKSDAVVANLVEQVRVVEPTWSPKTAEAVVRARIMWWGGQPRVDGSAATRSR